MSNCVKCGNKILTGDVHWEMGLCNNCYNELYKDHKTHISLDKMWLELAQSFRDENEKLQDKVADLEAKLAESKKQCQECKHLNKKIELNIKNKLINENQQLKQSQKHLAIEQLEKVEEILWNSQDIGNVIDNDKFLEKLNYLIKSLKGER